MVRIIRGTGQKELESLIDDYQSLKAIRVQGIGGYKAIQELQGKKTLGKAAFIDLGDIPEGIDPSLKDSLRSVPRIEFNLRNGEIYEKPSFPSCGYSLTIGETRGEVFPEERLSLQLKVISALIRRNRGWEFIVERDRSMPVGGKELREGKMRDLGLTEENSVGLLNGDNGENVILTMGRKHKKSKRIKGPMKGYSKYVAERGLREFRQEVQVAGFQITDTTEADSVMQRTGFPIFDAQNVGDGRGIVLRNPVTGETQYTDLGGSTYTLVEGREDLADEGRGQDIAPVVLDPSQQTKFKQALHIGRLDASVLKDIRGNKGEIIHPLEGKRIVDDPVLTKKYKPGQAVRIGNKIGLVIQVLGLPEGATKGKTKKEKAICFLE